MKFKIIFSFLLVFIFLLPNCKKDDKSVDKEDQIPLVYTSIVTDTDTMYAGTYTNIRATATGYEISYIWTATAGDILGSGNEVQYAAPPCVQGTNQISCTVKDGYDNTQTKTISIVCI